MSKTFSPFHCGSEKADWHWNNCDHCRKGYDRDSARWRCDLERALDMAFMKDGEISVKIAERIGKAEFGIALKCKELVAISGGTE